MRYSTLLSTLLCFATVFASPLHQRVVKRSASDICVSLNLNLDILDHIFGHLDACVCLSTLDIFIEENAQVKAASKKFGVKKIKERLLAEINNHHKKKKCTYPPHAKPSPAPKCHANSDPCTFTCKDGFVPGLHNHKRTCDCPAPKLVYNGKCIDKPHHPGGPQPSHKPKPHGHH